MICLFLFIGWDLCETHLVRFDYSPYYPPIVLLLLSPRNLCFLSFGLYPGVGSRRCFQGLVGGIFLWGVFGLR